jgi:hypothetical protein
MTPRPRDAIPTGLAGATPHGAAPTRLSRYYFFPYRGPKASQAR